MLNAHAEKITELQAACLAHARTCKWERKPIDADEISTLARVFFEMAHEFQSDALQIDLPLITRAVRYLSQAHGMPGCDDKISFRIKLAVLIEVARPNSGLDDDGLKFLSDMNEGIRSLLQAPLSDVGDVSNSVSTH